MKTVVIGAGAGGSVCAYFCKQRGDEQVILIEKNEKLGKKLYITGKGRCNITNNCDEEKFLSAVVSNPKFLLSSLYNFSPADTMEFFESLGLPLKTERGDRVFPVSDKSSDVIKCLLKALDSVGVELRLNEKVLQIDAENGKVIGVKTDKEYIFADKVVVATGGLAYPLTGSTGDGYQFAKSLGHTVTDLKPSLCGVELYGDEYKNLQGLTLKNVKLSAFDGKTNYYSEQGEMLFTHYGVSGPLVFTASTLTTRRSFNDITFSIDLKPALSDDELNLRVLRDFSLNINKEIKNSLDALLPKALIPLVIKRSKIPFDKKCNLITKEERLNLVKVIKNLDFKVKNMRSFDEAVVTSGGVSVKEVNPKTMESKIIKGLYFVGEVLDVDAFTGGYNLQIAFSTGKCAGLN